MNVQELAKNAARRDWAEHGSNVHRWAALATRKRADLWGSVAHQDQIADTIAIAYERYVAWREKHAPTDTEKSICGFLKSAAKASVSRRFGGTVRQCPECGWKPLENAHRYRGKDCRNCGAVLPALPRTTNEQDGVPTEELATFEREPTEMNTLARLVLSLPQQLWPFVMAFAFPPDDGSPPSLAELAQQVGCSKTTAFERVAALKSHPAVLQLSADTFAAEITSRLHLASVRGETLAEIGGAA